ncbi:DUF4846 domain-containing protein [Ichthyenterobacterium sp. W332]|uniref:DUF4846 domain-containing protein n=1 Tax=Microcosmobacter mediterraneus TaxID=3075607 RepID=A0ABU2YME7_9FLAO|nr:DUF4846 domain-containing protein [Ichthyenterobacterium sp. W332]MDT0559340.1 DUF4846 domain-containing protein [Ichthyenterobacterium sp. W332]
MKKSILCVVLLSFIAIIAYQFKPVKEVSQVISNSITNSNGYINTEGKTVKERITIPDGFKRVAYAKGSFQDYIRHYKLKPFGAKVINYDGSPYFNQIGHFGILEVPVPENGLQQCADALIRLRSEYLWEQNRKNDIGFNFTSGHNCSWTKYAEGYRPKINGNKVIFSKTATANHSKANFYKYLNLIYMYSGTISLFSELPKINDVNKLKIGDMLIIGGSPGHVVMIADVIEDEAGKKYFALLQGNTPAQSVHLLKNLEHNKISPWYKLKLGDQIEIPGYTFYDAKFVRFK